MFVRHRSGETMLLLHLPLPYLARVLLGHAVSVNLVQVFGALHLRRLGGCVVISRLPAVPSRVETFAEEREVIDLNSLKFIMGECVSVGGGGCDIRRGYIIDE